MDGSNPAPAAGPEGSTTPGPYDDWQIVEALGSLPGQAASVPARFDLRTVGQLKDWVRRTPAGRVENFGDKTRQRLIERLARLDRDGPVATEADRRAMQTLDALADAYFRGLQERERQIFRDRFVEGLTLEEAGSRHDVTRERIRQIVDHRLREDRPEWGPHARRLLAPGLRRLEEQGGVALSARLRERLGSPPPGALELALALAEAPVLLEVLPGLATTLSAGRLVELRSTLYQQAAALMPTRVEASVVDGLLARAGLIFAADERAELYQRLLGVTLEGDHAYRNEQAKHWRYLSTLESFRRPVSAQEVARRINEADPSMKATFRSTLSHFRQTPDALMIDRGLWVHRKWLRVDADTLAKAVARGLSYLEQANGHAVSPQRLLEHVKASGKAPAGLTTQLLRESLRHTGKVRTFHGCSDLAWRDAPAQRRSVFEWVRQVASEREGVFEIDDLFDEVTTRTGYLKSSMGAHAYDGVLLPLTYGRYLAIDNAFPAPRSLKEAVEEVAGIVQRTGAVAADASVFLTKRLRPYVARYGSGVIWGLATLSPRVATTRPTFMWPRSAGPDIWDALRLDFLQRQPVFKRTALRDHLGMTRQDAFRHQSSGLTRDGLQKGQIAKLSSGWYIDAHLPVRTQVELLCRTPKMVRLALTRDDVVRHSPSRDLFLLMRLRLMHDLMVK